MRDGGNENSMTISPVSDMHQMVKAFNLEVVGLPLPETPERLSPVRKDWALSALREELGEFAGAETLEEEVDALLDLTYFALGRVVEMGVAPRAAFEEVHAANMRKRRGSLAKRPGSLGYDAIKPEGWKPPDLAPYLSLDRDTVIAMHDFNSAADPWLIEQAGLNVEDLGTEFPRVAVIGHARHGKDTVCELLRDIYGLRFTSSSRFCAGRVLAPLVWDINARHRFLYWIMDQGKGPARYDAHLEALEKLAQRTKSMGHTKLAEYLYNTRGKYRKLWYDAITHFNTPDRTALAREILQDHDVYCGIRNSGEFHGAFNAGLFDLVIWVDASERVDPEARGSCTVEPWMAHYVLDNNGPKEWLERNLWSLMDQLGLRPAES